MVLLLATVPLLAWTSADAGEIVGEASAIDGDLLNMQIRLSDSGRPRIKSGKLNDQGRLIFERRKE